MQTIKYFGHQVQSHPWKRKNDHIYLCAVPLLAQVTEENFHENSKNFKNDINKILHKLNNRTYNSLTFFKQDNKILKMQVYSDASFASNYDRSPQIGYNILLSDRYKKCQALYWDFY